MASKKTLLTKVNTTKLTPAFTALEVKAENTKIKIDRKRTTTKTVRSNFHDISKIDDNSVVKSSIKVSLL